MGKLTAAAAPRDAAEPPGDDRGRTGEPSDAAAEEQRRQFVLQLYERHRPGLLRYLSGLLPRRADAEDVLQETYARLLDAAELELSAPRARAYLFRIATNLARDRFRKRRENSIEDGGGVTELTSPDASPEGIVDFAQGMQIVKSTLLELKPRCRQVFLLRASGEASYEAIARKLGVSKRTVEREMRHALEVMQTRLKRSR